MPRRRRPLRGVSAVSYDPLTGAEIYIDDTEAAAPSPGIIDRFKIEFNDAVTRFDNAVSLIGLRQQQLAAVEPSQDDSDYGEWNSEMNKLNAANSTIATVQNAVMEVSSWWNSVKSMFGLAGQKRLGALPLIVPWGLIATIGAAAGGLALLVSSSGAVIDKLTRKAWSAEQIRRSQAGLEPLPEPVSVNGGGIFDGITDLGKMLIWGFAAYLILPPLIGALKK